MDSDTGGGPMTLLITGMGFARFPPKIIAMIEK
jgi:hypothetical protein